MVFPKNASEQVRVFRENYKGHDLINARVFFRDSTEAWKPAKKGTYQITITADATSVIPESNETNNTLAVPFTVTSQ